MAGDRGRLEELEAVLGLECGDLAMGEFGKEGLFLVGLAVLVGRDLELKAAVRRNGADLKGGRSAIGWGKRERITHGLALLVFGVHPERASRHFVGGDEGGGEDGE